MSDLNIQNLVLPMGYRCNFFYCSINLHAFFNLNGSLDIAETVTAARWTTFEAIIEQRFIHVCHKSPHDYVYVCVTQ